MFVLSDTHFDHENIIDYCNRPFNSVDEMNKTIVKNWNITIGEGDKVLFIGDLTISGTAEAFLKWIDRLNGEIHFVVGDHDDEVLKTFDRVHIYNHHYQFEYNGCEFYCVHNPDEVPTNWDSWILHGHHHSNWSQKYPFLNLEE